MELDLAEHVGAVRYERTLERTGFRSGYRERPCDTRRLSQPWADHTVLDEHRLIQIQYSEHA